MAYIGKAQLCQYRLLSISDIETPRLLGEKSQTQKYENNVFSFLKKKSKIRIFLINFATKSDAKITEVIKNGFTKSKRKRQTFCFFSCGFTIRFFLFQ